MGGPGLSTSKPNAANHLLNVSFRAIKTEDNSWNRGTSQHRAASGCRKGPGYEKNGFTSQTQYLNASHRFLMFNGPSVRACLADSDYPVDWEDVDIIIVGVDEKDNRCPICLCPAICPRVTPCGHIYCFGCILRHFGPERKYKASCPMCYKEFTYSNLRGVVLRLVRPPAVGCSSRFMLVRRERTSLIPLSASLLSVARWDADLDEEPREGWRSSDLSRVAVANLECTIERLSLEGETLYKQHQECQSDEDMEALPYIEWAMQIVEEQMRFVINRFPTHNMKLSSIPPPGFEGGGFNAAFEQPTVNEETKIENPPLVSCQDQVSLQQDSGGTFGTMLEGSSSFALSPLLSSGGKIMEEEGCKSFLDVNHGDLESEKGQTNYAVANLIADGVTTKNNASGTEPAILSSQPTALKLEHQQSRIKAPILSFFTFYQLCDGVTLAFLHPLCMRSLLEEHGNGPLALPTFIEGRVLEVERIRLTKDVKNRYAFLRHLPQLSIVAFVELDLTDKLSYRTLQKFRPEILKRERRRKSLAKRENELNARTAQRQRNEVEAIPVELMDLNGFNFPILMDHDSPSATLLWENGGPELQNDCIERAEEGGRLCGSNSTTVLRTGASPSLPCSSFRNRLLNQIPDNLEDFPSLPQSSPEESGTSTGPPMDILHHSSPLPPTWVVSSPVVAIPELDSPSKRLDPLPIGRKKRGGKKGVKKLLLSGPNPGVNKEG